MRQNRFGESRHRPSEARRGPQSAAFRRVLRQARRIARAKDRRRAVLRWCDLMKRCLEERP